MHQVRMGEASAQVEAGRVDHQQAYSSLLPLAAVISAAFAASVIVAPLYPLYQHKFGFSQIILTLIYAAYVVGNVAALLFFGQISDHLGRKRVALAGLGLAGIGAVVFLFAGSIVSLYVGRFVIGLAVGILSGTGTAWLADRTERRRATLIATGANLSGVAIGPILGGLLAEYGPRPLESPFMVYLVLIAGVAIMVARAPESRPEGSEGLGALHLRPRIGLPTNRLGAFAPSVITGFTIFSLGGLYFALIPTVLSHDLHLRNAALAGVIVAELAGMAIVAIVGSQRAEPTWGMRAGLLSLMPAVGLLVAAQSARSLGLLLLATSLAGLGLGFGYLGSLQVVNQLAPPEHRAAVASGYFLACFVGNSIPVIGMGVLSTLTTPLTATIVLACVVSVLCLVTLTWSWKAEQAQGEGR